MASHRGDRGRTADLPVRGTGVTRYVIAAVVIGVLFVVLAAQNASTVTAEVLPWTFDVPLYAVAIGSALFGAAVAESLGAIWRHRRRRRNEELRELIDLRDGSVGDLSTDDDSVWTADERPHAER